VPDEPGLSAGVVARRLGVAVTTLRSWHRRYGLGPTGHDPGQHRRYTRADLERLGIMMRLTAAGMAPAEAARRALAPVPPPAGTGRPALAAARDGGGAALRVGRGRSPARGLARAAMRLDAEAVRALLVEAIAEHGVVPTWEQIVRPVLSAVGDRHAASTMTVAVEHLLSGCVSAALGTTRPGVTVLPGRVLLACTGEEQHSLPIETLAAALAERGVAVRMLGARVPPATLVAAVRRTGPTAVGLWAQVPAAAVPAVLLALAALPARPHQIAALGPGWARVELPDWAGRPAGLPDAVSWFMSGSV